MHLKIWCCYPWIIHHICWLCVQFTDIGKASQKVIAISTNSGGTALQVISLQLQLLNSPWASFYPSVIFIYTMKTVFCKMLLWQFLWLAELIPSRGLTSFVILSLFQNLRGCTVVLYQLLAEMLKKIQHDSDHNYGFQLHASTKIVWEPVKLTLLL